MDVLSLGISFSWSQLAREESSVPDGFVHSKPNYLAKPHLAAFPSGQIKCETVAKLNARVVKTCMQSGQIRCACVAKFDANMHKGFGW
jgi:hypothetical protein